MAKTHRNKYFQGYKKLKGKYKNILEFNDFENDQEEGENYWELELTDGRKLVVDVQGGEGMAGEPMEMVFLKVDDKTVRFKEIEHLIKDKEQAQELSNYLDDVAAGNDASARSFTESANESSIQVIDPKKPGIGKAEWKVISTENAPGCFAQIQHAMKGTLPQRVLMVNESKSTAELDKIIPKPDYSWSPPSNQLYRWVPPIGIDEYFKQKDMHQSGSSDIGFDHDGKHSDKLQDIPFFTDKHAFFGYGEAYARLILDKSKLIADGYVIYDPKRDKYEVRVKAPIKDWKKYLIAFEINRSELVMTKDEEREREFPIPLPERYKQWKLLADNLPANKIKVVDDEFYEEAIR